MIGDPIHTQHHPRVLNALVQVDQACPHHPDLFPQAVVEHAVEPAGLDNLSIVVQQQHILAIHLGHHPVVDGGVVEGLRIVQHLDTLVRSGNVRQERQGVGIVAGVVDDNELEAAVGGLVQYTGDARPQNIQGVTGGDDDGYQRRRSIVSVVHPVAVRRQSRFDLGADTVAGKVRSERCPPGLPLTEASS